MFKVFKYSVVIAFVFCLFFSSQAANGQINLRDSLQVILNDETIDANYRFTGAYNLIFFNSSPEEAEELAFSVMLPFVQKTWDNEASRLTGLARLYLLISFCHRERGGDDRDEKERLFLEKALETAIKSGNNSICARSYEVFGFMEIKRGDVPQAHEYLYQAIVYYDKMEQYVKSSEMLYVIASNFLEIKDAEGLQRVLLQMEEYLEKDASKQSLYQYNVVQHNYFDLLLEIAKKNGETVDYMLVDTVMFYIRKNIDLVENLLDELSPFWMHGYAYYFMAKAVDDYFPEQTDTIFLYLDKALEMMYRETFSLMNEANSVIELQIFINNVRANALFKEGKTQKAYITMNETISLLEKMTDYKNISEQRYKAYQFMANYYENANRPADALKYLKLLRESEAQRYETEKVQALNDMSIKYETEKKEMQIQTLIRENITARRILWLIAGLSLMLLITFFFVILLGRLKRKNVEQQLYETALLAELRQSELEKMQQHQRQQQRQQQQLEHQPVKNTIEKITWMIEDSMIEKDAKKTYLERLTKIDLKLLENACQSSQVKITGMDMKYIVCFAANIDTKDVSLLFNVEPKSVNTVRYRIKKKFAKEDTFRMIL